MKRKADEMAKQKWFLIEDSGYTRISNDPMDESRASETFESFKEAKAKLVEYHKCRFEMFQSALREAKKLKQSDFETHLNDLK